MATIKANKDKARFISNTISQDVADGDWVDHEVITKYKLPEIVVDGASTTNLLYTTTSISNAEDIILVNNTEMVSGVIGTVSGNNSVVYATTYHDIELSGSGTFTAPAGTDFIKVLILGAGGNGGASNSSSSSGGGGAGGEHKELLLPANVSYTFDINADGTTTFGINTASKGANGQDYTGGGTGLGGNSLYTPNSDGGDTGNGGTAGLGTAGILLTDWSATAGAGGTHSGGYLWLATGGGSCIGSASVDTSATIGFGAGGYGAMSGATGSQNGGLGTIRIKYGIQNKITADISATSSGKNFNLSSAPTKAFFQKTIDTTLSAEATGKCKSSTITQIGVL